MSATTNKAAQKKLVRELKQLRSSVGKQARDRHRCCRCCRCCRCW